MSDQKQVNEADLDWLAERDQPLTDEIRSAQQQQFTSGYAQEARDDLSGPSCHVCGAIMVRSHADICSFRGEKAPCKCGWKCLSCGTTTGCS